MKNVRRIFFLSLIIGIFFVFPVSAQKTRSDFQKMYVTYLSRLGYNPSIDEDGDILFKIDGYSFFILVNEKDPQLFEVMYAINLEGIPLQRSLEAANYANRNSDAASIFVLSDGNTGIISIITILLKPADFQKVFARVIELINEAEGNFASQLR